MQNINWKKSLPYYQPKVRTNPYPPTNMSKYIRKNKITQCIPWVEGWLAEQLKATLYLIDVYTCTSENAIEQLHMTSQVRR